MIEIETIEYWQGGKLLWSERMNLSRLFAPGDDICQDGQWYRVRAVEVIKVQHVELISPGDAQ